MSAPARRQTLDEIVGERQHVRRDPVDAGLLDHVERRAQAGDAEEVRRPALVASGVRRERLIVVEEVPRVGDGAPALPAHGEPFLQRAIDVEKLDAGKRQQPLGAAGVERVDAARA